MRRILVVVLLLLVSGVLSLLQSASEAPAPEAERIRLAVLEGVLIEDFLRTLRDATVDRVEWNTACKEIRGQRMIGGTWVLEGSQQRVLRDVGALLTFYELKLVSSGPVHDRVHRITYNPHTCGLCSGE